MKKGRQRGFTIIEVSLFISISALLFVSLLTGINVMVDRSRFSTSIKTLETLIRSQYEEVRSGINSRNSSVAANICGTGTTTTSSGSSNCLLLGKMITFDYNSSAITISYVTGTQVSYSADTSDDTAIALSNPKVTNIGQETSQIQWGGTLSKGVIIPSTTNGSSVSNTGKASVAILRSPLSSDILVYATYLDLADQLSFVDLLVARSNILALVVKNAGAGPAGGAVCINPGASSNVVKTTIPVNPSAGFATGSSELISLKEQCLK